MTDTYNCLLTMNHTWHPGNHTKETVHIHGPVSYLTSPDIFLSDTRGIATSMIPLDGFGLKPIAYWKIRKGTACAQYSIQRV